MPGFKKMGVVPRISHMITPWANTTLFGYILTLKTRRIWGRTYIGVKSKILPLYLKGRFYANILVLYLTGRFYATNFGAYSLVLKPSVCT